MRKDLILVNVPYYAEKNSSFDRGNYRKRLVDFLHTIETNDAEKPKAIILDVFFRNDTIQLNALKSSIKALKQRNINVYGVYDMRDVSSNFFERHDGKQARELYENYFKGYRLHTIIDEYQGVLTYDSELLFPREYGGFEVVKSLVSEVANDINENEEIKNSRSFVLPVGNREKLKSRTFNFLHANNSTNNGSFSEATQLDNKIILVGSFKEDYLADLSEVGTHLVTWALNDQLKENTLAKQPINSPLVIIALLLFFSAFVVIIYALLFKYVKKLQTKPIGISILSFLISLVFLIATGFGVLSMNMVIPVGLVMIGMLISSVLSARFAYKFLVTGITEGSGEYDVFISYSHGNSKWVEKNVYKHLKDLKTKDGGNISIFFDKDSIGIGEAFTVKYMYGIVNSKIFIPIISEEYYKKNHCKNEMDLAYKRWVEELIKMLPIAFSFKAVPPIYQHVIFTDVSENENFIEQIKKDILQKLEEYKKK